MILQAILVGLVAGYGRIEQSWFGQQMIARPIWLCTLVGLLLGDLKQGVIIGGTLELIWAGVVQIGAAPTEVVSGSVLASALVITSGLTVVLSSLTNKAVENCDTKMIWWTGIGGGIIYFVVYFVVIALGFMAGSVAIQAVIDSIPGVVRYGLTNASKLLPAIGIGILLKFTFDWKYAGFFALGFLLPTYLGMGTMGVALTGLVCAYIYYQFKPRAEEDD